MSLSWLDRGVSSVVETTAKYDPIRSTIVLPDHVTVHNN